MAYINGTPGDDTLFDTSGDDIIYGGDGNDVITISSGSDAVYGGDGQLARWADGDDTLIINWGWATERVQGHSQSGGYLRGSFGVASGNLGVYFEGIDRFALTTGSGNDIILIDNELGSSVSLGAGDDYVIITKSLNSSADGGSGIDSGNFNFSGSSTPIYWNLQTDTFSRPAGSFYKGFEHFGGHSFYGIGGALTTGDGDDRIVTHSLKLPDYLYLGGGNDVATVVDGLDLVDGGAGTDTLVVDYSDASTPLVVYLLSLGADGYAGGVEADDTRRVSFWGIERLTIFAGAGDDTLIGGDNGDILIGAAGNDVLIGGAGNDTTDGGTGDDTHFVQDAGDVVVERAGEGRDTVYTTVNYALAAGSEIEVFGASDAASTGSLTLIGNEFGQYIYGNAGSNLIVGGGGGDVLVGLGGNDDYLVSDVRDLVLEDADGGFDTIYTTVSHTIGYDSHVELLTAHNQAGTAALTLIGNRFAQTILGNAGNNLIVGGGGGDVLIGFGGDDDYLVSDIRDYVGEDEDGGFDTIYTTTSHTIGYNSHVELLTAHNQAGTEALALIGNRFAQTILGNAGNNFIVGGGGGDILVGFGGDDDYLVTDIRDYVAENENEGFDSIYTTVSHTIGYNSHVELLTAHDQAGTEALTLIGNRFGQSIYGNAGNNLIVGGGGSDLLIGLGGDDDYLVKSQSEIVVESAGGGIDTVYTIGSYALSAGSHVERLIAHDQAGTAGLSLIGNAFDNLIIGNAGANYIDGQGGNDVLIGGAGADTFAFTTALGANNVDSIVGFGGDDTILLSGDIFTALAAGTLSANAFVEGSEATSASHRIIYNSSTGALLYDADGSGSGAAVQFANIGAGFNVGTAITAGSFTVTAFIGAAAAKSVKAHGDSFPDWQEAFQEGGESLFVAVDHSAFRSVQGGYGDFLVEAYVPLSDGPLPLPFI